MKSLDQKLAAIKANSSAKDFIIADAKDADMAFGIRSPGPRQYLSEKGAAPAQFSPEIWSREEFGYRNIPEYMDVIREVVGQGLVDIMLMSAYINEQLTIKEELFRTSHLTPASRANDTTDVWAVRHGSYIQQPAQTFRSASIDHIQCGKHECDRSSDEFPGANLGLYSVTFVNDLEQDRKTLNAFKAFREEAERKRFRYFLEVFNPNVPVGLSDDKIGEFVNDHIVRSLAGVTEAGRPVFLKIVYQGPRLMEELVQYDPNLVVGILGGSAGTTLDAFQMIHDAQKYGARVALYGRKINNAEHQLAFIQMLRYITDGVLDPEEAVRAYHGTLESLKIHPTRSLADDLVLSDQAMSYGGGTPKRKSVHAAPSVPQRKPVSASPSAKPAPATGQKTSPDAASWPTKADGSPDFASMTSSQRHAYHKARLNRTFG